MSFITNFLKAPNTPSVILLGVHPRDLVRLMEGEEESLTGIVLLHDGTQVGVEMITGSDLHDIEAKLDEYVANWNREVEGS